MKTDEIRSRFLKFFEARGHRVVPSANLAPLDDPTLLFTGAGMNPFKEYFLGQKKDMKRAASSQKCLRTGDLENVGRTAGHLTFFEMLGNFSFGDYFKEDAIRWAWEFLTKELQVPESRLSVSVYTDDNEAFDIWHRQVGLDKKSIRRLGDDENFWPANARQEGPNGPCGPCSEIYFDETEIWNLVFTQFERQSDKTLTPLPQKNIDTGMGLERLAAVLQGKANNFEIDIFQSLSRSAIASLRARGADFSGQNLAHLNAILDHARAVTLAIADGVMPSNEGRGYVIRKLIRLATTRTWCLTEDISSDDISGYGMSHGKLISGILFHLVPQVVKVMKHAYPELENQKQAILRQVRREEHGFLEVWKEGGRRWQEERRRLEKKNATSVDPEFVFRLHDTYGFPLEASRIMVERFGLQLDLKAVRNLMDAQRKQSRSRSRISGSIFEMGTVKATGLQSVFRGYETPCVEGRVTDLFSKDGDVVSVLEEGAEGRVVLNQTPFYAEQGGQIGDQGQLKGSSGVVFEVEDTQYAGEGIVHLGRIKTASLRVGDPVQAEINDERRWHIRRNHTATHLLHSALRNILGAGVRQSGSLVSDEKLRFDFTYPKAVGVRELEHVEELVNQKILENTEVRTREMDQAAAKNEGAIAFFGEKYGTQVRVVDVAGFSKEFCGGTHCRRTGDIGTFKIISEGSVAQGVRRIEAVTGWGALRKVRTEEERIKTLASEFKTSPEKSLDRARELMRQVKGLEKELSRVKTGGGSSAVEKLMADARKVQDVMFVAGEVRGYKPADLRGVADRIRERMKRCVIVLASAAQGKAAFVVSLSHDLKDSKIDAGRLASALAKLLGGSGGGRKDFAQAGGRDVSKLGAALKETKGLLEQELQR